MLKQLRANLEADTRRLNRTVGILAHSLSTNLKGHVKEPAANAIVEKYKKVEQLFVEIQNDLRKL